MKEQYETGNRGKLYKYDRLAIDELQKTINTI